MSEQIPFEYQHPPSAGIIEGDANQHVLKALRRPEWASGRLAIIGPHASGKTSLALHLVQGGAAAIGTSEGTTKLMSGTGAPMLVIDNFARFIAGEGAEEAFFHLLNRTQETGQKVVIFSRSALTDIPISLADLRSRLGTFESVHINPPDDMLIIQLIARGFERRGVIVQADVINYLSKRVGRSYADIFQAVEALDVMAMRDKGKVNKARVRAYLDTLSPEQEGDAYE